MISRKGTHVLALHVRHDVFCMQGYTKATANGSLCRILWDSVVPKSSGYASFSLVKFLLDSPSQLLLSCSPGMAQSSMSLCRACLQRREPKEPADGDEVWILLGAIFPLILRKAGLSFKMVACVNAWLPFVFRIEEEWIAASPKPVRIDIS